MSEFKTVGPTRFGVGDGATRKFSVGRPGDVVQSANIESVRKVGWQGDVLLSPRPRTNLALFSNDFANTAWKGSPSLYIDFAAVQWDPRIDFSRASDATGWVNGRLHEFGIDEPRLVTDPATGYSGLLLEPQSTNLLRWSRDMSNTGWLKLYNSGIDPYSDQRGLLQNLYYTSGASHFSNVRQNGAIPLGTGLCTVSFNMKLSPQSARARIFYAGSPDSQLVAGRWYVNISPDTGDIVGSVGPVIDSSRSNLGDGVFRYRISVDLDENYGRDVGFRISTEETDRVDLAYLGNIQVELGHHASSYIPTEDGQATRAADHFRIPVGDWYRPDRGTLVVTSATPTGELVAKLGDVEIYSDSDEAKEYRATYSTTNNATELELGVGTFKSIQYYNRVLS